MSNLIKYGEKIESTRVLGPGSRAVIWVFGCGRDCPGCIGESFRKGTYNTASARRLADWYLKILKKDGITISGGEPMLQAEALARMLRYIKSEQDTGVIVYTGYLLEDLQRKAESDTGLRDFLDQIDVLIDGPYIASLNDDVPYRGSSNQRIIPLTDRYKDTMQDYYRQKKGRPVELYLQADKTLMVGVPGTDQAAIWGKIKNRGCL